MKRFCSFLFLFFCFFAAQPQNLIPDWSAEEVYQCPDQLGFVELFLNDWTSLRGSPDYFHSCCELPQLCWNNSLGYQEPRTGEGYIGAVTYFGNLPSTREYFGISLSEPMEVGESYFVSFYVSMGYSYIPLGDSKWSCNNIGFLLMTANYLDSYEQGVIPNFSHYQLDTLHSDTTSWVKVSTNIVADSAYNIIAFGNFYDDANTLVEAPFDEKPIYGFAYYYFDDFCVSKDSSLCNDVLTLHENTFPSVNLYPNPTNGILNFQSSAVVLDVHVRDITGQLVDVFGEFQSHKGELNLSNISKGVYLIIIETQNGVRTKRVLVQ